MADILVENHGSICLLNPQTDLGREWLDENIGEDAMMFGNSTVCEPRYVAAIVDGMIGDGLEVEI